MQPSIAPRLRGRPPKNPAEPRQDTRALLIRTGVAVLTEKGYSAVGIDEILRQAAVPKGSFYHCFESKEAFGQALIAAYAEYFARKLDRWLLDAGTPPLQRLRRFIGDATQGMERHGFRRGCLVGNLGQEMGTLPESFRAQLGQVFADWQARCNALAPALLAAGSGQACAFVTQRLATLQKTLFEAGSHPQQQAEALAYLEGDEQGLAELALLGREALWQLQSIIDATHSRWPRLQEGSGAGDQTVAQWGAAFAQRMAQAELAQSS